MSNGWVELLVAERDKTTRTVKRIESRLRMLEEIVNQRRRAEAKEAVAETDAAKQEAEGKHPIIQKVAQDNAVLSEELSSLANTRQGVTDGVDAANKEAKQINADFQFAQHINPLRCPMHIGLIQYGRNRGLIMWQGPRPFKCGPFGAPDDHHMFCQSAVQNAR